MKRFLVLAVLALCFLSLPACCGDQPPSFVWQPLPTFQQTQSTPMQTVKVPMYAAPVQYSAPAACAPAAIQPVANPCLPYSTPTQP